MCLLNFLKNSIKFLLKNDIILENAIIFYNNIKKL